VSPPGSRAGFKTVLESSPMPGLARAPVLVQRSTPTMTPARHEADRARVGVDEVSAFRTAGAKPARTGRTNPTSDRPPARLRRRAVTQAVEFSKTGRPLRRDHQGYHAVPSATSRLAGGRPRQDCNAIPAARRPRVGGRHAANQPRRTPPIGATEQV
jgi:hypothetical protein